MATARPDPKAEAELAACLAHLHAAAFAGLGRAWGAAEIAALLADPGVGLRIAHHRAAPGPGLAAAGFALFRTTVDEAELLTLAVEPAARRAGLGRGLLAASESGAAGAGARRLYLEVAEGNAAARALYAAAGYRECGRRRHYYNYAGRREDALVLEKPL